VRRLGYRAGLSQRALANAINEYAEHAERRTGIGTEAELVRLDQAALAPTVG
jgi:hypothetical protein